MDINSLKEALEQQEKQAVESSENRTSNSQEFNFRNQKAGERVIIRFVQDGDPENKTFWVAKAFHKLTFTGVKNDPSKANSTVVVTLPAYNRTVDKNNRIVSGKNSVLPVPESYAYTNKEDPIQVYASQHDLFNHPEIKSPDDKQTLSDATRRKISYLFQGFVIETPRHVENGNEVPFEPFNNVSPRALRHFTFGKDVFDAIVIGTKDLVMDGIVATDLINGVNFIVEASEQGNYINRSTSRFERKQSQISAEQATDLKTNGYDSLKNRLLPAPTPEQRELIKTIFEAYLASQPFDMEWAKVFPTIVYDNNSTKSEPSTDDTEANNVSTENVSIKNTDTMTADELLTMLANGASTNM